MSIDWNELDDIPVTATWQDAVDRAAVPVTALSGQGTPRRRRLAPIALAAAIALVVGTLTIAVALRDEPTSVSVAAGFTDAATDAGPIGAVGSHGDIVWLAPTDPVGSGVLASAYDLASPEILTTVQAPDGARPLQSILAAQNRVAGRDSEGRVWWWTANADNPAQDLRVVEVDAQAIELSPDGERVHGLLSDGTLATIELSSGAVTVDPSDDTYTAITITSDGALWAATSDGTVHRNGEQIGELEGTPVDLVASGAGVVGILPSGGEDGQFRYISEQTSAFEGFGASGTPRAWHATADGITIIQDSGRIVRIASPGTRAAGIGTAGWLPGDLRASSAPNQITSGQHPELGPVLIVIDSDGVPTSVQLDG